MRIVVWKYHPHGNAIALKTGIGENRCSNCSTRGEGGASTKPAAGRQGATIFQTGKWAANGVHTPT